MIANKPDNVFVRDLINSDECPMHYKRAWRILEKWCDKGWYSYGVTLDLGWLTEAGLGQADKWSLECYDV